MSRLMITTASRACIHQFHNLKGELYKCNANISSHQKYIYNYKYGYSYTIFFVYERGIRPDGGCFT